MINVTINGQQYQVDQGLTIIEVCDNLGIKIPRFCYHKNLSIPANCRMCLVEVEGFRKPVPSCHTMVSHDMTIHTENKSIDEIRKGITEFLLINHPLDCPICDEGGECELQNQAVVYGFNDSSYSFPKRKKGNKELGPLISTYMLRCINCTRCVRFMDEVSGFPSLGVLGRGEDADISNYFQEPINSEISGNLVDICPVGALNNAQYLFSHRRWELTSENTIDIMDTMGSEIRVDIEKNQVVRILPIDNEDLNQTWISDKSRYICDALDIQRIDAPWIRVDGKLKKVSFDEAFAFMKEHIKGLSGNKLAAIAGDFTEIESMVALKELMFSLGSDLVDCRTDNIAFNPQDKHNYLFNTSLNDVEQSDCILIVGSNPKIENPLLNIRIRKAAIEGGAKIGVIGDNIALNYPVNNLGGNIEILLDLIKNKNDFAKSLKSAKKPLLIIGEGAFYGQNTKDILNLINLFCDSFNLITKNWNGLNFLHSSIGKIGGLCVGFTPKDYNITVNHILDKALRKEVEFMWLLGADTLDFSKLANTFVVYQGHHGGEGAKHADVVLPGSLWLEKSATYINMEGRVLQTKAIKKTKAEIKEDWKIIRYFSELIGHTLPFNTLKELRDKISSLDIELSKVGQIVSKNLDFDKINSITVKDIAIKPLSVTSLITDYYLTDIISKNSATMAKCSQLFNKNNITG